MVGVFSLLRCQRPRGPSGGSLGSWGSEVREISSNLEEVKAIHLVQVNNGPCVMWTSKEDGVVLLLLRGPSTARGVGRMLEASGPLLSGAYNLLIHIADKSSPKCNHPGQSRW